MKLFLPLLLLAASAQADTYWIPNVSGGSIVLQETLCIGSDGTTYKNLRNMYSYNPKGEVLSGCWFVAWDEGMVHATYWDGSKRVYPAADFIRKQ